MRKKCIIVFSGIIALLLTSCGPSKEEAIKYNDQIIDEQSLIVDKINVLYEAMKSWQHNEVMDEAYNNALKQIDVGTEHVAKMDDFGGKSNLKEHALKLFALYQSVIQNEIKGMLDILKKPSEEITPEMEQEFDNRNNQALTKMENGLKEFQKVQKDFADKYNFVLNKTSEETN